MPEDNLWADVTEGLRGPDLARLLDGAAMSNVPGVHFEYSNVGWAVLGRIVEHVAGMPAREYIRRAVLSPLGMARSSFEAADFPPQTIAVGYRGREGEGDMDAPRVVAPIEELGVSDTAGGIFTTARDLARYVSFQVGAWPPRDDPEAGPLRRSSVREMQQGARSFWYADRLGVLVQRAPPPMAWSHEGHTSFRAPAYGFGLTAQTTCEDDHLVEHGGGLPGYVTHMTMLPEKGFGMVVFLNDQRAHSNATEGAMKLLRAEGLFVERPPSPAPALAAAPRALHGLLARWDDATARSTFEPSFFRYQTIEALAAKFARLARDHGACHADGALDAVNRLRGRWREACERGSITFAVAVAPGPNARLQGMRTGEDLPPSAALTRAGGAVIEAPQPLGRRRCGPAPGADRHRQARGHAGEAPRHVRGLHARPGGRERRHGGRDLRARGRRGPARAHGEDRPRGRRRERRRQASARGIVAQLRRLSTRGHGVGCSPRPRANAAGSPPPVDLRGFH